MGQWEIIRASFTLTYVISNIFKVVIRNETEGETQHFATNLNKKAGKC